MNRTIGNAIWAILLTSGTPIYIRAECLYAVCNAHNLVDRRQQGKTLEELLREVKPSVAHLRTFGSHT